MVPILQMGSCRSQRLRALLRIMPLVVVRARIQTASEGHWVILPNPRLKMEGAGWKSTCPDKCFDKYLLNE